jgi:hypothetical protein
MSEQTESRPGQDHRQTGRKAYEAPRLARVSLEADEVLAIGCKMVTHGGAALATINCTINKCGKAGS